MKLLFSLAVLLLVSCSENEGRKVVFSEKTPEPIGPYSHAISAGGFIFVSGQIALRPDGSLDSTTIEAECEQALNNIKAILEETGLGMDHICKTTIYLKDLNNYKKINTVYARFFGKSHPARETVQVSGLPKNAHVEISVIAKEE